VFSVYLWLVKLSWSLRIHPSLDSLVAEAKAFES